jgi:CheY-like chemotaxis protein
VRDGEQEVDQWSRGGVDLVLMDAQMPGTNCLQATRRIHELGVVRRLAPTRMVAVTANAMNGDR